jgi:hypothetical protein
MVGRKGEASSSDLPQPITRQRMIRIRLQCRHELTSRQIPSALGKEHHAEIRMRVGVVRIGGKKALELARRLIQLALPDEQHAEVVERIPVVGVASSPSRARSTSPCNIATRARPNAA